MSRREQRMYKQSLTARPLPQKTIVFTVRISKHTKARIKQMARNKKLKPSMLVRHFILQGLKMYYGDI